MLNNLQILIFEMIEEMENSTGGGTFGPVAASDAGNSLDGITFKQTDMRGDFAANNASNDLSKKHKRTRKKEYASKILRRLPIMDPKKTF